MLASRTEARSVSRYDIWLTYLCVAATLVAFAAFIALFVEGAFDSLSFGHPLGLVQAVAYGAVVSFLVYGGLVYEITRVQALKRRRDHRPAPRADLEAVHQEDSPSVVVLVPSYKEDVRVVRQTLLSAALQDYPDVDVVLLIDDPPAPANAADRAQLEAARALPHAIMEVLERPQRRFGDALADFRGRAQSGAINLDAEAERVARLLIEAARWLEWEALQTGSRSDHAEAFFAASVFRKPASELWSLALDLRRRRGTASAAETDELLTLYRRLTWIFGARVTAFERKRYRNLSHEPNKAMNLNSAIAVLGQPYVETERPDGVHLEPEPAAEPVLPHADYVIMLDADSILLPDYALRLVHRMEQPGNESVAVVQTPYSAFPAATQAVERVAGATTDIQYITHQGFSGHGATYWVGANALLRREALDDIATVGEERGFEVRRYIQDRTVIEDTESTIDLAERGWTLVNYPERLSYSATPPDFGALAIQRQRWANGGLLILPKALRYLFTARRGGKFMEGFLRFHYLTSIAGASLGLLFLILVPVNDALANVFVPLASAPYFLLLARDLRLIGYRARDAVHVYALNLALLPVNLSGVFASLRQAVSGSKSPFKRTPKVRERTGVNRSIVLGNFALLAFSLYSFVSDVMAARIVHGVFTGVTSTLLMYAIVSFMGVRASIQDLVGSRALPSARIRARAPRVLAALVGTGD